MLSEFKQFLLKANVLALALAFILGVALAAVVNSLVKDILLPPVGLLFGGVDFNSLFIDLSGKHPASLKAAQDAGLATINYGVFINTVITFIIVAFVVFLIARSMIPVSSLDRFPSSQSRAVVRAPMFFAKSAGATRNTSIPCTSRRSFISLTGSSAVARPATARRRLGVQ